MGGVRGGRGEEKEKETAGIERGERKERGGKAVGELDGDVRGKEECKERKRKQLG